MSPAGILNVSGARIQNVMAARFVCFLFSCSAWQNQVQRLGFMLLTALCTSRTCLFSEGQDSTFVKCKAFFFYLSYDILLFVQLNLHHIRQQTRLLPLTNLQTIYCATKKTTKNNNATMNNLVTLGWRSATERSPLQHLLQCQCEFSPVVLWSRDSSALPCPFSASPASGTRRRRIEMKKKKNTKLKKQASKEANKQTNSSAAV